MVSSKGRLFFDTNLLLEVILDRKNSHAAEIQLTRGGSISSLTGHLVTHFKPTGMSLGTIMNYLHDFTILDLRSADFDWAYSNMRNADFEDALQIAVAIRNGCSEFITLDKQLYEAYKNLPTLKLRLL